MASNSLKDEDFGNILEKLNTVFKSSKIRFTFDGECMHRFSLLLNENEQTGINSGVRIAQYLMDVTNGPLQGEILPETVGTWELGVERKPEMEWTPGYINIYFVQNLVGASWGWFKANTVVVNHTAVNQPSGFERLVHEIGHSLGLSHTFDNGNIHLDCLCNNPEANNENIQLCTVVQDCLCDTKVDPHSNDLDEDSAADGSKWVDLVTCTQKTNLISHYDDGCGAKDLWEIPFINYMSLYTGCRHEFSPCQKSLMHDATEAFNPHVISSSCPVDPYFHCLDYIVEEDEIWTGEVLMCRGQKIIVRKEATLTLDNAILTIGDSPDSPEGCPNLTPFNLWDGIYIEGKEIEQTSNGIEIHGRLIVNNSTIEYAKNGINAPVSFGAIYINKSIIQKCGKILDVRDVWPFSYVYAEDDPNPNNYQVGLNDISNGIVDCGLPIGPNTNPPPFVKITDSTISCDEFDQDFSRPISQLKVSGSKLYINNCDITNSTDIDLTAINQSRGQVAIVNGTEIQNFNIGVYKGVDILSPCLSRGLIISNSNFEESSIENHSNLFLLEHNKISGSSQSAGFCHQKIYANKFLNTNVASKLPMESSVFSENYFNNSYIEIDGDNTYTDLNCNKWNSDFAVNITNGTTSYRTHLPEGGWGSPSESSGNIRENDNLLPSMWAYQTNYESNNGKFPHYVSVSQSEQFDYFGKIEAKESDIEKECFHDIYPLISPIQNEEWSDLDVDLIEMEQKYDSLESIIDSLIVEYNLASGSDSINLFAQISQKQIFLQDFVGTSLRFIDLQDSTQLPIWVDRSNPLMRELSELSFLWYIGEFNEIITSLQSKTDDDAESLLQAADWLDNKYSMELNLFELSSYDIDTLTEFANASFGNYTNILRSFLFNEYDIYVGWPEILIERNSIEEDESMDFLLNKKYYIVPNPTNNCFTLNDFLDSENNLLLQLYDFSGKIAYEEYTHVGQQICIADLPSGMYFVKILDTSHTSLEVLKLIKN